MADPLSIIGTAGAIANIVDALSKTITTVCDMRQAWKIADVAVFAFENQLNLLKYALCKIQKWAESKTDGQSHQLVMLVDNCVTCCRLLIALRNALEEQTKILQQPQVIQAFQVMDQDTASLIVHRDSDSIITATSISSSRWSAQFAFDRELFITKVYEKWIRKLAASRRSQSPSQGDTVQQDHKRKSGTEISSHRSSSEAEKTNLVRIFDPTGTDSSRGFVNLGERFPSSSRTAVNQDLNLLRRIPASSQLDPIRLQAKQSHRIDKGLKVASKLARREIKAVILGSKTRKRVFEEMRMSDGCSECYTAAQLSMFRPIIFEAIFDSVQYLVKKLISDETIRADPILECLEDMLINDKEGLDLQNGLHPPFIVTVRKIMEHPATKTLMADASFVPPDSGKYFLNQIERILHDDYLPTSKDAINCATALPGCVEFVFKSVFKSVFKPVFGNSTLSMRLTDPGNATANRAKLFPRLEPTKTVIFIFDLGSSRGSTTGNSGLVETMLELEATINSHWFRNSNFRVIFNNFNEFKERLTAVPLSSEFPDYTGGNDATSAVKYLHSRISVLNRPKLTASAMLMPDVYHEKALHSIWANIHEMTESAALRGVA
ncbi:GNA-3 g alpha subunit GNA-3 [Fusarium beomiforme]|uniref:GNA-3 g alpha subunit GNA-3 n=1 Tax=Fusarium beomiforme TaxID=44412 RepID=A0A9P5A9D4_9HYPO|nr:GNA-3 g alpha subunit GNA-3 [Fusarium beomiforme]